jgi:hypothetical protein
VKVEVTGQHSGPEAARISTEWQAAKSSTGRSVIQKSELLEQVEQHGAVARSVAEALLEGAAKIGADVEFGDASGKARIYNSSTRRPATLFVVTRRGTFYVRSFNRWLQAAAVGPELAAGYVQKLTEIIGKNPKMAAGDAAGRRAPKLEDLQGKEEQILGAVQEVIAILRDSPAPERPEEAQ